MATLTKQEKAQDLERAKWIFDAYGEHIKTGKALLLVHQENGKGMTDYLRATLVYTDELGNAGTAHLTWAIAKLLGYSLRDRNGRWYLSVSGYGYSKADELARTLAHYYGIERVRYELA